MNRYAVIDKHNRVINVIVWDGVAKWAPPEGCRVERNEDAAHGDIWIEELKDFVRPLSNLKQPEDENSLAERQKIYEEAKALLKSSIMFSDLTGKLEV